MAVFSKSQQEVERIIAVSRVLLAASSLFALWMDPVGTAWFNETGVRLNLVYGAYSLTVLVLAFVRRSRPSEVIASQIFDLVAFMTLIYLTRGSTLFFVYLAFSMFCGALRWGWKGTAATSTFAVATFSIAALTFQPSVGPSEFELNRTITRLVYLVMAGGMLAYLGLYEARLREEIERLARWPTSVGATEETATEKIVAHASDLLGAVRAVLVWELEDEPAVRVASWSKSGLTLTKHRPSQVSALLPEEVAAYSFVAAGGFGASSSITLRDARGALIERSGIVLPADLLHLLDGSSSVSAPFRTERLAGRIFFLGVPSVSAELLPITEIVAREIGTSLDQMHLSHRLQEVAASEERIRVSRDLHDGVLQSLTGIRWEMKSVADSLASRDDEVRARLLGLERALAIEQRELRYFIGGLKPAVPSLEEPDSLTARLETLKERLALEWNTPVSIRVEPESRPCPGDLAQAVPLMVHEAVVNALKHAQPTRVNVNVDGVSDRLRIVVSDDGHGFPFKGRYDHRALGESRIAPKSLFDRVTALGGKMSIESSDAGSRIEMVVSL